MATPSHIIENILVNVIYFTNTEKNTHINVTFTFNHNHLNITIIDDGDETTEDYLEDLSNGLMDLYLEEKVIEKPQETHIGNKHLYQIQLK